MKNFHESAAIGDLLLETFATTTTTPDDMWEMLKDIDRADLKAEVARAVSK